MQFIICLVIIVLLEIVAGILGFVYRGVVVRTLREYMCSVQIRMCDSYHLNLVANIATTTELHILFFNGALVSPLTHANTHTTTTLPAHTQVDQITATFDRTIRDYRVSQDDSDRMQSVNDAVTLVQTTV